MIILNNLTEIEPYCKEEIEFVTIQKHVGLCEINTQFFQRITWTIGKNKNS
jgi:hypothetical protein